MNVRVFRFHLTANETADEHPTCPARQRTTSPEEDHMSRAPIKILLQTTIIPTEDDWSVGRFSQLARLLAEGVGDDGQSLYEVTARHRGPLDAPDPVLSTLHKSDFDQLWLFAVDTGAGLTPQDSDAISRFHQAGGGLMVTRDH